MDLAKSSASGPAVITAVITPVFTAVIAGQCSRCSPIHPFQSRFSIDSLCPSAGGGGAPAATPPWPPSGPPPGGIHRHGVAELILPVAAPVAVPHAGALPAAAVALLQHPVDFGIGFVQGVIGSCVLSAPPPASSNSRDEMLSHIEDSSQYPGYSSHLHAKLPLDTWRVRECVRPLCLMYIRHMCCMCI